MLRRATTALLLGALALAAAAPGAASAQSCAPEREPNDELATAQPVSAGFCVAGGAGGAGQDTFLWTVQPGEAAWTLRLQGLPGMSSALGLQAVHGVAEGGVLERVETLLTRASSPASGDIELPPLALPPGDYLITVATAGGPGLYRLSASPAPAGEPITAASREGSPGAAQPQPAPVAADELAAGDTAPRPSQAAPVRTEGAADTAAARAVADDGQETEPNDADRDALVLVPGRPRTGRLDRPADVDTYSFHLRAAQHVVFALQAPADLGVEITLGWGTSGDGLRRITTIGRAGEPQTARWEGLLQTGDYVVTLTALAGGQSAAPYRLSLELGSRFELPADLEPNDAAWQAAAAPPGGVLRGRLDGRDTDVFRIRAAPASLRVVARRVDPSGLGITLGRSVDGVLDRLGESVLFAPEEELSFSLPEGEDVVLLLWSATGGDYEVELDPAQGAVAAEPPIDATLELTREPIAAFVPEAQRVHGELQVRNRAAAALALETAAWTGDERWEVDVPVTVYVPAGETVSVPVALAVPAHAETEPVAVELALTADGFAPVVARANVTAAIGTARQGASAYEPLPPTLRGGLNVAWTALGGSADGAARQLVDGVIDAAGYALDPSNPPVVDLAGDGPVPVAGVILYPPPGAPPADRLAEFAIETSADGTRFTRVLEARASPAAREQAFPFPAPVAARAVRLVPLSAHARPTAVARLAELKVVAEPSFTLPNEVFDLGSSRLGGHVVRARGWNSRVLTGPEAHWPGDMPVLSRNDANAPPEWVIGFLNARAARIGSMVWHAGAPGDELIRAVDVAASTAGPFGPWVPLGRWNVSSSAEWSSAEPVWARAVRFRVVEPTGTVALPGRIELIEAPGPSIVGEWGDASSRGPYELTVADQAERQPAMPGGTAADPTPLPLDAVARGEVRRGDSEHWYALELPDGARTLRVRFVEQSAPEVAITLLDAAGNAIELAPDPERGNELIAPAGTGRWRLRVVQPPQSLVVSWDTSISTTPFVPHVERMVRRLAAELDPAHEQINLLPFGSGAPLLESFSSDAAAVRSAFAAYAGAHTSSDADGTLIEAAELLAPQPGARAAVLVTDAVDSVERGEALWDALDRTQTRVFALHLPIGDDPASAGLLLDWSVFTGGFYTRFASQGDAEAVFRRISAWLRQPARYAFSIAAETAEPPTGKLLLRRGARGDTSGPAGAVEIVLDGSGSMLQRLGGVRRIEVARAALARLAEAGLPPRTDLALRVFGGGGEGSCASDLSLPLAPFDAAALTAAVAVVQPVDGARTPIAESLRLAGADLAATAGLKLIVLVTDGEETCGGDPEAEIRALRAAGLDVRVSIVGFALEDDALKDTFAGWAAAGGGAFFDAADGGALDAALRDATRVQFDVLAADGRVVATGGVDGEAVALPAGSYTLRVPGAAAPLPATVRAGATTNIEIDL